MLRVSDVIAYHKPPHLVRWEERKGWAQCERIREKALGIGTLVDERVQNDIQGIVRLRLVGSTNENYLKPVANCIKAWENFKESGDGKAFWDKAICFKSNMQKELVLGDLMGHPDFIFDNELPDLKTSKTISLSHWMQVAQYAKMVNCHLEPCEITTPLKPMTKISILRLDKYDERGVWEYKTLEEPFISMLQDKFDERHKMMIDDIKRRQDAGQWLHEREEKEFADLMRKKLEEERLG